MPTCIHTLLYPYRIDTVYRRREDEFTDALLIRSFPPENAGTGPSLLSLVTRNSCNVNLVVAVVQYNLLDVHRIFHGVARLIRLHNSIYCIPSSLFLL